PAMRPKFAAVRMSARVSVVTMRVSMDGAIRMTMLVCVLQMNGEFNAFDARFCGATCMKVVTIQTELGQFSLEFSRRNPEVQKGAYEHVAADAAKDIEI